MMRSVRTAISLPREVLIEAINRGYEKDPPTTEEKKLLQGIREEQRKLLVSES